MIAMNLGFTKKKTLKLDRANQEGKKKETGKKEMLLVFAPRGFSRAWQAN